MTRVTLCVVNGQSQIEGDMEGENVSEEEEEGNDEGRE